MDKKLTLDDIFNDDNFGLLDTKPKTTHIKNEDDRLIDSFEEINAFIDKAGREPGRSSMSEYSLYASLRHFKEDEASKKILKPYDRHNLLGNVEMEKSTIDDILNDDDLGLLEMDNDLDIFKFNHTPKPQDKAETDFVARRTPIKEKDFEEYEKMFQKVHQELKEGKRKFQKFEDVETHLHADRFYLLDGLLLYLESVDFNRDKEGLSINTARRKDGRTRIIFENATLSNMLYRSLGKSLYTSGKLISEPNDAHSQNLFVHPASIEGEDTQTGWIYIVKSMSNNPKISSLENLYKIGFASTSIDERIKNAKNEATYLFADVRKIATYQVMNLNANKLESLLHRFFAKSCLNVDIFDDNGQRITPREWFVVPFEVIDEAVQLMVNGNIVNYEYDTEKMKIKLK